MGYINLDNIFGYRIPEWVHNQLMVRSKMNSKDVRDDGNLLYLANKTGWVRLVSSIDIKKEFIEKIKTDFPRALEASTLAKQYVLFGGTSAYKSVDGKANYDLRSGIENNGAYQLLGAKEVQEYGYRPMPGIKSAKIITQGKLGSIRSADIQFTVNDKMQLDLVDMLYFKLGYTMFLEWGNTYYYKTDSKIAATSANIDGILDASKLRKTEDSAIDPFEQGLDKDKIRYKIMKAVRDTDGNYDAMLGIVTNFTFTSNINGGYDCTLKLQALGYLGESIRINGITNLPKSLLIAIENIANVVTKINKLKREAELKDKIQAINTAESQNINNFPQCVVNYINKRLLINTIENNVQVAKGTATWEGYEFYSDKQKTYKYKDKTGNYDCDQYGRIIDAATRTLITNTQPLTIDEYLVSNNSSVVKEDKKGHYAEGDIVDVYIEDKRADPSNPTKLYYFRKYKTVVDYSPDPTLSSGIGITFNLNVDSVVQRPDPSNPDNRESFRFGDNIKYALDTNTIKPSDSKFIIEKYKLEDIDGNGTLTTIFSGPPFQQTGVASLSYFDKEYKIKIRHSLYPQLQIDKNQHGINSKAITFNLKSEKTQQNLQLIKNAVYEYINDNKSKYNVVVFFKNHYNDQVTLWAYADIPVKNLWYSRSPTDNETGKNIEVSRSESVIHTLRISVAINDFSLIGSIQAKSKFEFAQIADPNNTAQANTGRQELEKQLDEYAKIDPSALQKSEASQYRSQIECILRTIQLNTIASSIGSLGEAKITEIKWANKKNKDFLNNIHLNGAFSNNIANLIDDSYKNTIKSYITKDGAYYKNENIKFEVESYMGFHRNIMKNPNIDDSDGSLANLIDKYTIDYKSMFSSYLIPYYQSQDLFENANIHYPTYIPLSWFFFLINHCCLLYETKNNNKPIFYLDFNTWSNVCQSNDTMLCTDPFKFIVPFTGNKDSFKKLFDPTIVKNDSIDGIPVWTGDSISDIVKDFKISGSNTASYRGRFLNCLISIDYLLNLIRSHSSKDETNAVYFKSMVEELLSDYCKSTGTFNYLRLAYDDDSNCFYVVDDQDIPSSEQDKKILQNNEYDLPLYGKESIATSLQINTDISTRIANVVAISANADVGSQTTNSTDATAYGKLSNYAIDRYKPIIAAASKSNDESKNQTEIESAQRFNYAIDCFYRSSATTEDLVNHATSYYIDRVLKAKNKDTGTNGTMLMPLSLTFTTDGISGLGIMNGFTINENLLPYSYSKNNSAKDVIRSVGFVVTGLDHSIESNRWTTSVKSNMYYLKSAGDYTSKVGKQDKVEFEIINQAAFSQQSITSTVGASIAAKKLNYSAEQIINAIKNKGYQWYDEDYKLNIVGVRNSSTNNIVTDKFDDIITLTYKEGSQVKFYQWAITTDPGLHYVRNFFPGATATGRMVPSQYINAYSVGIHRGKYEALIQQKPIKAFRDANKNDVYDEDNISQGLFFMNIHKAFAAATGVATTINDTSAGCQVFASTQDFLNFMKIVNDSKNILKSNAFTYTLLTSNDII